MKLRIGETWICERTGEQFVVEGLSSIDEDLAVDEAVVPRDGDSEVEGRVLMPLTGNVHSLTFTLRELVEQYERAGTPP